MQKIVFTNPNGSVSIVISSGDISITEVMAKDVPADATNARYIDDTDLPQDRLFRNAWDDTNPETFVGIDMVKAGEIAHGMRRVKRDEEFAPHDEVIQKQIPGADAAAAENARVIIRTKYDSIQVDIDSAIVAVDEAALRAIITTNNL